MFGFSTKLVQGPPSAAKIIKNLNFGTAVGLTKTAKEGQAAVQGEASRKLNRKGGNWMQPSSRVGIRITPATPQKLQSEIKTAAYFGELQDEGGTKLPFSRTHLAIPAKGGPLANTRRIPDNLKPKALVATGKAWIEKTEKGTLLLVTHGLTNKGKYRGVILWYILVPRARIKETGFFHKTAKTVADRNLSKNIATGIDNALRTMR